MVEVLKVATYRVAKYHRYDGYIRVKIFAGWGKKFGRTCRFAKSSLFFWKICTIYVIFLCINLPNMIELS